LAALGELARTLSDHIVNRIDLRWMTALLAVAVAAAFGGYLVGVGRPTVSIHTGMAHSGATEISVRGEDGWVYDVPLELYWTDSNGIWHENGRPDCLPPTNGVVGPITFAATQVTQGGVSWRPVIWVSCRGA
jgi:hypothetical protein